MSVRYVAFDVETTGLIPGVDRIIELAAVSFEGPRVLESFQQLVDPGVPIPRAASQVNGITDQMVQAAPPLREVLESFLGFLGTGTPVAHNAVFDVGFITAETGRTGHIPPAGPVLDTRGLARSVFPRRASYSLQNLARDLNLEKGTHRALSDAHACRELFLCCRQAGWKRGLRESPSPSALAAASGAPLDFICHKPRHAEMAVQLSAAMESGRDVRISYRSATGATTERDIRPIAFAIAGGSICVRAHCRLRGEERTFRLDAILHIYAPAGA
ncbi:MAG TPA: exonuclease domain-containing protein [Spirochaetia bacterium]|nr:exonuclease domain-containing protein [Spirochaetia bacterium]